MMNCFCGRVGIYRVNKDVFCFAHKAEAVARKAKIGGMVGLRGDADKKHMSFEDRVQRAIRVRKAREKHAADIPPERQNAPGSRLKHWGMY